jgi:hypothetical protein
MKFRYELVLALGLLMLGISADASTGQAGARTCASEECACEKALAQNTVEALEAFLKKYPQSAKGTSACAALAVPPDEGGLVPEGQSHEQSSPSGEPAPSPVEG